MLSARELALEQNPQATGWVNQRIIYTHGIGVAMVAGQRGRRPRASRGCSSATCRRCRATGAPDDHRSRGSTSASGRAATSSSAPGRTSSTIRPARATPAGRSAPRRAGPGTTGIELDTTLDAAAVRAPLPRPRPAHQRPGHRRQPAPVPPLARATGCRGSRRSCATTRTPTSSSTTTGRLVYVQDAYTTSDRFPNAQGFDPARCSSPTGLGGDAFNYIRNSVKITMDAYDGTMHFYVADPDDPIIRAYAGRLPDAVRAARRRCRPTCTTHLRVPEELFNVQTRMFGRYHVTDPQQFFRSDDLWTVPERPDERADACRPRRTTSMMRMPGETEAEFLLLQPMVPRSRPNMIAWVAARMDAAELRHDPRLPLPGRHDGLRSGPDRGADRRRTRSISAQITLWNQSGSTVIRGNLIVVPVGDSADLPPAGLPAVDADRRFPEFQRIVVASPREVVWARTLGDGAASPAGGGGGWRRDAATGPG